MNHHPQRQRSLQANSGQHDGVNGSSHTWQLSNKYIFSHNVCHDLALLISEKWNIKSRLARDNVRHLSSKISGHAEAKGSDLADKGWENNC